MGVKLSEWLELVDREYLGDFISRGGAAVKFALVEDQATADEVAAGISARAGARGCAVAEVDAATTRMHMIQDLFFAVARQLPWQPMVRSFLNRTYTGLGYQVPNGQLRIGAVAAAAGTEPNLVHTELRDRLQRELIRRSDALAKDFRWAMYGLCAAEAELLAETDTAALVEWLRGELRLVSGLKPFNVFRKIARHNARGMLASLGAWCRMAEVPGLVVILDLRQLELARRTDIVPDTIYYTRMALMGCYEVLRQLIDDTDDLTATLIVAIADPGFLDRDNRRGVVIYRALEQRVWPDVSIRQSPNPLSALVAIDQPGDGPS